MPVHKTNALRLLDGKNIPYRPYEYNIASNELNAVAMAAKLGVPPERVFKTLVARGDSRDAFFVFVIPGSCNLNLKLAAAAAGNKRMDMVAQRELFPLTGYVHGGCSPIGMKKLFPVFLDETARLWDTVFISGGRIGLAIEIPPSVLAAVTGAFFRDIAK